MSKVFRSFMAQAARGARNFSSLPEGKQTISSADECNRKVMRDIMFGGFVFVGGMGYYVTEYAPLYNAKQEQLKVVDQAIKQIKQQAAIKEQAKASAGPEEFK